MISLLAVWCLYFVDSCCDPHIFFRLCFWCLQAHYWDVCDLLCCVGTDSAVCYHCVVVVCTCLCHLPRVVIVSVDSRLEFGWWLHLLDLGLNFHAMMPDEDHAEVICWRFWTLTAEDSRWDTYMSVGAELSDDLQGNDPFWTVVCCENQVFYLELSR